LSLSPHFTLRELTRTSTGLPNDPSPSQVAALTSLCLHVLEPIRALLGVPLRITSGFRGAAVNAAIKGAAGSQHMRGEAADIVPVGVDVETAMGLIAAARLPVDQVIVYPRGGFLHVSSAAPRVNRGELLRSAASGGSGGPYSRWTP
jgi:uncharacterized protein YcbK (DUF882 family)